MSLYVDHFRLNERPFTLVPDPDFLFWSEAHERAYTMLEYGVVIRAPITLITGEVGAGKTTLLQQFLRHTGSDVRVGLISNPQGDPGDLLRRVLLAFERTPDPAASYATLHSQFEDFLIGEYAAGRRTVLIFDEAQHLSRGALEELRMLTNINSGKDELLQLILVGQPELRDTLRRPDMRQFAQRVASSFHLGTMTAEMVADYVNHRLARAGAERRIFSNEALMAIHAATGGVPRLVNQLCDLCMVYAYSSDSHRVDAVTVDTVLSDGVFAPAELSRKAHILHLAGDGQGD